MADRPILFSAVMVRALLDGRKTQTRRILKPQPTLNSAGLMIWDHGRDFIQGTPADVAAGQLIKAGDRLWVRERTHIDGRQANYAADFHPEHDLCGLGYRPSIHMPRWASRLTLTVTEVRVERLQEIIENDADAEGWPAPENRAKSGVAEIRDAYPIGWYAWLWETINGPGAWDANPWVVAYTFTVERKNIDEVTA
ncbi:hypothetical protein [Rhizobium rhizophilum]|uniref:ASCH domain-containing protein n=1 Tax=Rhizobium rhizophilum TaxID=1850373 RepID=A0ABY2QW23_9HYPH|nr:hypothetical protein [Rhizobium rhizophilum]THV13756.1 hypothetical protein E9677_12675 [Rhizobium rhizophilum]